MTHLLNREKPEMERGGRRWRGEGEEGKGEREKIRKFQERKRRNEEEYSTYTAKEKE